MTAPCLGNARPVIKEKGCEPGVSAAGGRGVGMWGSDSHRHVSSKDGQPFFWLLRERSILRRKFNFREKS